MNTVVRNPRDAALIRLDDLVWKGIVKAATDAVLPANTRTGNVLTADANGAFPTVDGVTINTNGTAGLNDGTEAGSDKILVRDEATGANNGKYFLSDPGSASKKWKLTRTSEANASSEVTAGFYVFVDQGTVNPNSTFVLTTDDPITLNTTSLTFAKFSGLGQITAGSGMTKTGDTLNVIGGDGIVANADDIAVDFNTTNLKITAGQINTIQDIDTTASPTFGGLVVTGSGEREITLESTSAPNFAASRWINDGGISKNVFFANFGSTATGTYFGISRNDLGVLLKEGGGNLVIGPRGAGFLVLGANDIEIVRIDSTPLVTITGDAIISQHAAIGANSSIVSSYILHLNESRNDDIIGTFIQPKFTGSTGTNKILRGINMLSINAATGTATAQHFGILSTTSHETAINGSSLTGARFFLRSLGGGTGTIAEAIVLDLIGPTYTGAVPTTHNGIKFGNHSVAGMTTSYAIRIAAQTGATTPWAIAADGGNSYHIGNFAIGSSTVPPDVLSVTGNMSVSGRGRFNGSTDSSAIGVQIVNGLSSATIKTGLQVNFTSTGTESTPPIGGTFTVGYNPGGSPTVPAFVTGVDAIGITAQDNGASIAEVIGGRFRSGAIDNSVAATDMMGVKIDAPFLLLETVPTNSIGIKIADQGKAGITVTTGLKIEDQTSSTSNFAIITGAGNVGFGIGIPTEKLDVLGNIAQQGTNAQKTTIKQAVTELTGLSGATVTASNLIPAGSFIIGVTIRVTTTITGATSFDIGDGTDVDRWGATIALTAGTTTTTVDFTAAGFGQFATANDVVLTANGANFTAGAVRITVHYITLTAATS